MPHLLCRQKQETQLNFSIMLLSVMLYLHQDSQNTPLSILLASGFLPSTPQEHRLFTPTPPQLFSLTRLQLQQESIGSQAISISLQAEQ